MAYLFVLQSYGDVREVEENYIHTYGPGVWVVVGVGVFFACVLWSLVDDGVEEGEEG